MNKLLFLLALVPALASAQIQVQGSAGFTLELPVVIPQLVVVTPGIEVVPDVDYEVFHTGGYYWTRHEGRWYRSGNPRSGWVFMPRGVPPGLTRMPPGKYRRWRGPPPARGAVFGGPSRGPGPVFRGDDRRGERRDERGHDRGHGGGDRGHDRDDRGRGHGDRDDRHGGKHDRHD